MGKAEHLKILEKLSPADVSHRGDLLSRCRVIVKDMLTLLQGLYIHDGDDVKQLPLSFYYRKFTTAVRDIFSKIGEGSAGGHVVVLCWDQRKMVPRSKGVEQKARDVARAKAEENQPQPARDIDYGNSNTMITGTEWRASIADRARRTRLIHGANAWIMENIDCGRGNAMVIDGGFPDHEVSEMDTSDLAYSQALARIASSDNDVCAPRVVHWPGGRRTVERLCEFSGAGLVGEADLKAQWWMEHAVRLHGRLFPWAREAGIDVSYGASTVDSDFFVLLMNQWARKRATMPQTVLLEIVGFTRDTAGGNGGKRVPHVRVFDIPRFVHAIESKYSRVPHPIETYSSVMVLLNDYSSGLSGLTVEKSVQALEKHYAGDRGERRLAIIKETGGGQHEIDDKGWGEYLVLAAAEAGRTPAKVVERAREEIRHGALLGQVRFALWYARHGYESHRAEIDDRALAYGAFELVDSSKPISYENVRSSSSSNKDENGNGKRKAQVSIEESMGIKK